MPLEKDGNFGTNADGSKNQEYCIYCYKNGAFVNPDLTLQEMLDKVEHIMKQMDTPKEIIDKIKQIIPQLKRWKK
jgi:hypothetical protein